MSSPPILLPIGLRMFGAHRRYQLSTYRVLVLVLTFVSYAAYHLSRRPLSVVKNVLSRNCSQLEIPEYLVITDTFTLNNWCNWEPFSGPHANTLLGNLVHDLSVNTIKLV